MTRVIALRKVVPKLDPSQWECHDITLMIYVLLLMIPIIMIVVVQSSGYISEIKYYFRNGQFNAILVCTNLQPNLSFGRLTYLLILSVLLIVITIKARKIKHENFKDTKKVIALMTFLIVISCLIIVSHFMFDALKLDYLYIYTLVILGQCSFISLSIFFLFLPKLYPIIKQKISLNLAK